MPMESWRERGFVPDSDEEEFDSQWQEKQRDADKNETITNNDYLGIGFHQEEGNLIPTVASQRAQYMELDNNDELEDSRTIGSIEKLSPLLSATRADGELSRSSPELPDCLPTFQPTQIHPTEPTIDPFEVLTSSPDALQLDNEAYRALEPRALKAQAEIERDLLSDDESISSLTSPPSSIASTFSSRTGRVDPADNEARQNAWPGDSPPPDIPEEILRELSQPTRRPLRQRNPIQLHPYLLEDARYQSLLKARGLKPVRIPNLHQQSVQQRETNLEWEFLDTPEPPSTSSNAEFRFPPASPASSKWPRHRTPRNDDLPATAADKYDVHIPKRPKLSHPSDRWEGLQRSHSYISAAIDDALLHDDFEMSSIFDIPPSPPRSGSLSSVHIAQPSGFRFPRDFTPPALTTLEKNSKFVSRDVENVRILDLTMDDATQERTQSQRPPLDTKKRPTESEIIEDEALEVRRLRRKIKGVLPASWLRLDLKQQEKQYLESVDKCGEDHLAHRIESGKGVARRITKRRSNPNMLENHINRQTFTLDESDSKGSTSVDNGSGKALAGLVGFENPFDGLGDDDDIPEDNRIDYMPPSRHQVEPTGKRQRTKQKRIEQSQKYGQKHHTAGRHTKRQTQITETTPRACRRKKFVTRLPKLGILDAPDVAKRPQQDQPLFLRVAARQARSRRDQGRKSPTKKFLRLGTRLDTEDVNISLREWRRGAIEQTKATRVETTQRQREALIDIPLNDRNIISELRTQRDGNADEITNPSSKQVDEIDTGLENESNKNALSMLIAGKARSKAVVFRKPNGPRRHADKWIIPRKFAISSLKRNVPRPADLEESHQRSVGSPSLFHKALSALNRSYRQVQLSRTSKHSLTLNRFLSEVSPSIIPAHSALKTPAAAVVSNPGVVSMQMSQGTKQRRLQKRPPTWVNVNTEEHQQPFSLALDDLGNTSIISVEESQVIQPVRKGLRALKSSYTIDFGINPLRQGSFYHGSTFIGSGEFAKSLDILKRDLDREAGQAPIQLGDRIFHWGAWGDHVLSEFGLVFDAITNELARAQTNESIPLKSYDEQTGRLYRSVVTYLNDRLSFTDPVDRTEFVDRTIHLVTRICDHIMSLVPISQGTRHRCLQAAGFNLVLANQIQKIASHDLIGNPLREKSLNLVRETTKQLMTLIFSQEGLNDIRCFLDDNRRDDKCEVGLRNDHPAVDCYVISYHVLQGTDVFRSYFEGFFSSALLIKCTGDLTALDDIENLEEAWRGICMSLPLGEVDRFGLTRVGSRFRQPQSNWRTVKSLVSKVLNAYDGDSTSQIASLNNYCRVLFHRCFHMVTYWGWRDCRTILETLFDFFAKNTLHNLRKETSFGSPSFLDRLDSNPSLEVQVGDSCFHILLKIIGNGLRFMSQAYDRKKIRNVAWRLLPNHGRVYPKDRPLHREDLDALRNHHDLLCTLYWAVPDGCRPRVETIRDLVQPATSHQETCSLSLRSWSRLVRFKLSTEEDPSGLEPFADWHAYFVSELVKQHSLARTEAEAQTDGNTGFSRQLVESTISQNQRQIESSLNTALRGLKEAVEAARSQEQARVLMSGMPLTKLLGLFSPTVPRVSGVVSNALDIVVAYTQKDEYRPAFVVSASTNDDSQEYGDWTGIEAICEDEQDAVQPDAAIQHLEDFLHPAISRLISNCFGEDHYPEDSILLNAVECWSSLAEVMVRHRLRHWDSYVSPYGENSWVSLRGTVQTKKYTSQFLACCLEKDANFYPECKVQILNMWMSSLVERASTIKFQHRLTAALLSQDSEGPLFKNLPFSKDVGDTRYHITLAEFCQRRLSLISSLLSNMREHLQQAEEAGTQELARVRDEYRELIRTIMASMKVNYQELGPSTQSAQGAYVSFVHRIVEFLQQHTQNICPMDRFFTEETTFPLPAGDPTYIVAKLKSYGLRLPAGKTAKQLVMYFQSVAERAAVDGQQAYLINQLYECMADVYEDGNSNRPTLRSFLMQCVFSAYIEHAFSNPAAWIVIQPIVQTISRAFTDLLIYLDTTDLNCTLSITNIFCAVISSTYRALFPLVDHTGILEEPGTLITIAAFFDMITSALPVIDYMNRSHVLDAELVPRLRFFRGLAIFAVNSLDPSIAIDPYKSSNYFKDFDDDLNFSRDKPPQFFRETSDFASRELQTWLGSNLIRHEGRYFIRRNHQLREINITAFSGADCMGNAKTKLMGAAEALLRALDTLDLLSNGDAEAVQEMEDLYTYRVFQSDDSSVYLGHNCMRGSSNYGVSIAELLL